MSRWPGSCTAIWPVRRFDRSVRGVEQVRVRVEIGQQTGDPRVGDRQLDRGTDRRAGQALLPPSRRRANGRRIGRVAAVAVPVLCQPGGEPGDRAGVVVVPVGARPVSPPALVTDVEVALLPKDHPRQPSRPAHIGDRRLDRADDPQRRTRCAGIPSNRWVIFTSQVGCPNQSRQPPGRYRGATHCPTAWPSAPPACASHSRAVSRPRASRNRLRAMSSANCDWSRSEMSRRTCRTRCSGSA